MRREKQISNIKDCKGQALFLIGILLASFFPILSTLSLHQSFTTDEIQTGTFHKSNINSSVQIFTLDKIPLIGQEWNISIKLHENSTTNVIWTVSSGQPYFWEGPSQFIMNPNETVTQIYISHITGDNYGYIMLNFYLQLSNSTAGVSGSYQTILISEGYWENVGTGQLYVSDINSWLKGKSNSSQFLLESLLLLLGLIIIVILIKKLKFN